MGRVSGLVFWSSSRLAASVFWHFARAVRAVRRFRLLVCFFVCKKTDEQCKLYCCQRSEAKKPKDGTAESETSWNKNKTAMEEYVLGKRVRKSQGHF